MPRASADTASVLATWPSLPRMLIRDGFSMPGESARRTLTVSFFPLITIVKSKERRWARKQTLPEERSSLDNAERGDKTRREENFINHCKCGVQDPPIAKNNNKTSVSREKSALSSSSTRSREDTAAVSLQVRSNPRYSASCPRSRLSSPPPPPPQLFSYLATPREKEREGATKENLRTFRSISLSIP